MVARPITTTTAANRAVAAAVPQQLAPQQPAGGVNVLQRMMAVRTNAAPKPTAGRRDPTTFLAAPAAAAAASPAAADGAQDGEAAGGVGFAPNQTMLTVDVHSLEKCEVIGFCKLLDISYQGNKVVLVERVLDEIKRRNAAAKTIPLEAPVFQAALAKFARQRSQGDFKSKKKEKRKAAAEAEEGGERGTGGSAASPEPKHSNVTALQVVNKFPGQSLSVLGPRGQENLHCNACSYNWFFGRIHVDRVRRHCFGDYGDTDDCKNRHSGNLALWEKHKPLMQVTHLISLFHTLPPLSLTHSPPSSSTSCRSSRCSLTSNGERTWTTTRSCCGSI